MAPVSRVIERISQPFLLANFSSSRSAYARLFFFLGESKEGQSWHSWTRTWARCSKTLSPPTQMRGRGIERFVKWIHKHVVCICPLSFVQQKTQQHFSIHYRLPCAGWVLTSAYLSMSSLLGQDFHPAVVSMFLLWIQDGNINVEQVTWGYCVGERTLWRKMCLMAPLAHLLAALGSC